MPPLEYPPIALLAGKGDLPRLLINVFQSQQRPFVVVAFKEQTDPALMQHVPHLWLSFGEVGAALTYLRDHHIQDIVMAGDITRPGMKEIRPDWEGIKWLAKVGVKALGDDSLLKHVIDLIEEQGFRVVGPDDILGALLMSEGGLTSFEPDDQGWRDVGRGLEVLSALSPVDVGQAVVIQEGLVLGVEAIEGTDALIERSAFLKRPGLGGVLVKVVKRQQDRRVDLPTIGPETVRKAVAAGLRGIAVEAGGTLLLKREETIRLAQENGLFLVGLGQGQCRRAL